jgi:predicted short-subunit dehydrogenase-like oxidoreductase (DUF2520 family)
MKFSLAGTGNVAWHFSKMLMANGHQLIQVYARDPRKGQEFARAFNAEFISSPEKFSGTNDLVIIAVKDDAIAEVSSQINHDIFTLHPSGTTSINALIQKRKGVAWSVQSISKLKELDYSQIPFLVEASDEEGKTFITDIFGKISHRIFYTTSEQRAKAHMAAVFANNFVNQMYVIAEDLLMENHLPMDILMPSIEEQVDKIKMLSPSNAQTGPASRADMETLHKHLGFLQDKPELLEIYTLLTNRILKNYHGKKL